MSKPQKVWRSGPRTSLWHRKIEAKDLPKLVQAMIDDGLYCVLDETIIGYTWYIDCYPLQPKEIKDVWGLSKHQYVRVMDWIMVNDPFNKE